MTDRLEEIRKRVQDWQNTAGGPAEEEWAALSDNAGEDIPYLLSEMMRQIVINITAHGVMMIRNGALHSELKIYKKALELQASEMRLKLAQYGDVSMLCVPDSYWLDKAKEVKAV